MANIKISELSAASAVAAANELEINEAGTSKKITATQVATFVKADLLDDTTVNFAGTLQNGGSNVVVDTDIGSTVQAHDADTAKTDVVQTFSANQTFAGLSETQVAKSADFTPNLASEGTVFSCTGTMTITMPTLAAGKSFTIVHATGNTITWAGTIKWNGGAAPTAGTGIDIYVFYSDGTNWYGMQSGTGFA